MKHLCWNYFALVLVLALAATLGRADSLPSLQLVPSVTTVTAGEVVTLDLNIVGLGSPGSIEVGSFDSFIGFNPALLSPTGATFTLLLGDPSLFEAITAFSTGPYWAEATDVSLLPVSELDAMQPSSFTLATYSFVALGSGNVHFVYLGGPVDNGYGELIAGTKEVVPEPSSIVLLLSGFAGVGWRKLRRRIGCRGGILVLFAFGLLLLRPGMVSAQECANHKDANHKDKSACKTQPTQCDKTQTGTAKSKGCKYLPQPSIQPLALLPAASTAQTKSGAKSKETPEGGDMPPFNPFPFGTPVTDRLPRDPSTIVVLPTAIVNTGVGDHGNMQMHNEVTISVNPVQNDNYVYGANDYSLGFPSCGAYYSSDSAQTWTAQGGGIPLPTQAGYGGSGDPAVAFDQANNVYFSCLNGTNVLLNSAIYLFKSTDQGHTYGAPKLVASELGSLGFVDKEYVATDPFTNKVYVSWTHFAHGGTIPSDIFLAGSSDGGATFTSPAAHRINTLANRENQGSVPTAGAAANVVYVAWEDFIRPSIMVSKSVDGGFTFPGEVVVANGIPALSALQGENGVFRANSAPSIDVCRNSSSPFFGHIYVVWADLRNGDADIFLSRSVNGGVTWSAPVRVNDDPVNDGKDQFFPWISVDPNCKINIDFYDRRLDALNQRFHVFLTDSTDDGMTFLPNVRVTTAASTDVAFSGTFIGDYIGLTSTDNAHGTFHHQVPRAVPGWMDTTSGDQDVAAATALECGSSCGINIDLVYGSSAPGPANNLEVMAPGQVQVTAGFKGDVAYPQWPIWQTTSQVFDPNANVTTFAFLNPTFDVQPGGESHVGFVVVGNPEFTNVHFTNGGTVVGEPPVTPVDFRYSMQTQKFAAIFCTPKAAKHPIKIQRLQFAAAELPVQLEQLNPAQLPQALAQQNTQLADLPPPSTMNPGICRAVNVPGTYPKYKAMIFEADEVFAGDNSGNTDRFFVQAIAGAEIRQQCDVNADHEIDINDIRIILSRINTPAAPLNDPADADHDGRITANDARICALSCKNKNCVP